jgi:hypothetical protein
MPVCRSLGEGGEKRTRATIIDRAKVEFEGFSTMYAKLEQKVVSGGLSESPLINYGRCICSDQFTL